MNPPRKRPWSVAELSSNPLHPPPPPPPPLPLPLPEALNSVPNGSGAPEIAMYRSPDSLSKTPNTPPISFGIGPPESPQISVAVTSRKSTACPTCRKQKTKCVMEYDQPPCKRCVERGIECSPNKSIQDIMVEQARWNSRMNLYFSQLQTALNEARAALSLPPISAVEELGTKEEDVKAAQPEPVDEHHNPLEGSMGQDTLASAPVRSLYEVTKSSEVPENATQFSGLVLQPDFVSRGVITEVEAGQLTKTYLTRLDHFFYDHLQKYADISEIRRTSTLLALTLCTVAALHDPLGTEAYDKLSRELRSVTSSLMFRTHLGVEDIKAFCMASYWLGNLTWVLSGLVLRKAIDMQYHTAHMNQPQTDREAFGKSQMWLLIFLANEQISILHGSPACGVEPGYINWRNHLASPFSGEIDLRLISHIDLLLLLGKVRQTYGVDAMKAVPLALIPQLRDYLVQLDRWSQTWAGRLARNKWLGNFPSQAVKLHFRFAKFFICSHAFRGLNVESANVPLAPELSDIAADAVTTAISILEMLIESDELRAYLVGIPHYFHTMFAFASVFLLKVATRNRQHVQVDTQLVFRTIQRVLEVFQHCPCAKQHLVHRIAQGLKEMVERCESQIATKSSGHPVNRAFNREPSIPTSMPLLPPTSNPETPSQELLSWFNLENFDFLSMSPPTWNTEF
ncbi:hypothetical protein MGYG_03857 [Nannizzia gypsea CBS 118893]|uniref:Zn(2)-C6 fungal-type domain-containing protein n=1 Tax=Arthroderma gypseum (strain ATCC MYA-4604 / CBS 118893) TaxID=535722 RepID=E4UU85_ARTGP|nr:hypothetical protein MGYG_03857 [Nannizzia gypsea CBS 118893]EFR00852.1 hypothetical protein MGYG_03857 [Nannizzia gypsea CBS 118893]